MRQAWSVRRAGEKKRGTIVATTSIIQHFRR
jgi:hypothetical protein